jgi:hypothetical protein
VSYLLPDGDLLRAAVDPQATFGNPGYHGILQRFGWNGNLEWQYKISNDSIVLHHDIEPLPNGNILAIAWKKIDKRGLRAYGRDTTDLFMVEEIWEEVIYEIKPLGTNGAQIVWEWHVIDHIVQDFNTNLGNYGLPSSHPELLDFNYAKGGVGNPSDWLHFNSISFNADLNQILLSSLAFNEIYILDHSVSAAMADGHTGGNSGMGGDIIFRWGNPQSYGGSSEQKRLFRQHDPHWISGGIYSGMIMVFNNSAGDNNSEVVILNPDFSGNQYHMDLSGYYLPEDITMGIIPIMDFHSVVMSNAYLIGNDHLFSCEASKGRITEYDLVSQEIVWEYINPVHTTGIYSQGETAINNILFKAFRYPSSYSAFSGRNLTATGPLEQNPYSSDCWTTEPEDSTVDDSSSGFDLFGYSGTELRIYPNPASGMVFIEENESISRISILSSAGQYLIDVNPAQEGNTSLDISELGVGLYYILIQTERGQAFRRIQIGI